MKNLNEIVEKYIHLKNIELGISVPKGWNGLLDQMMIQINQELQILPGKYKGLIFGQIKDKFGGLRVYVDRYPKNKKITANIKKIIDTTEKNSYYTSYYTCENCGKLTAQSRTINGWIVTLCVNCYLKNDNL